MRNRPLLILFVVAFVSASAVGQTEIVTDKDLAKFREKRLKAERDYRENYERLGMPSPEELGRQRVEDKKTLIAFSNRIRRERYESELREAEIALRAYESSPKQVIFNIQIVRGYSYPYYVPYFSYGRLPYKRRHGQNFGWRVGGGVLSRDNWPGLPIRTQRPRRR